MVFLKVNKRIKGPAFEYTHEYRAGAVNTPLREYHAIRVGTKNLDIQGPEQLKNFLRDQGIDGILVEGEELTRVCIPLSKMKLLEASFSGGILTKVDSVEKATIRNLVRQRSEDRKKKLLLKFKEQATKIEQLTQETLEFLS